MSEAAPARVAAPSTDSRLPLPVSGAAALAALGGVLYFVSFAGIDVWPFAFVAQALLVVAIRGQSPRRAAWLGLLSGTAMALGGFYWMAGVLTAFGGFSKPVSVALAGLLAVYQGGGRVAILAWLTARAEVRGWSPSLAYAAAFAATELLYPLLFPFYAAASVHQVPVLLQVADLGGPILVGLVLTAVNLAFAEIAIHRLARRPLDRRVVTAGAAALAIALLYGVVRIRTIDREVAGAERATVGVVQANMSVLEKRLNPAEGVQRHRDATRALEASRPIDFVVWSESSVMYVVPEDAADAFVRARVTRDLDVPAIFGTVLVRTDPSADRERFFNTALSTDRGGAITGRYDKQYLLMFGEVLPFADTFPILRRLSPKSGRFTPGRGLDPLIVKTGPRGAPHRVTALICYEDILPAFVRSAVRYADPELLVNLTNDAWFGDTTEPWEHFALAKLRAIEHRRYLVRGTNSGVSAIVDPIGRVVARTETFRAETIAGDIRWLRGRTLYGLVGDAPFAVLALASAYMALRRRSARSWRRERAQTALDP
jgi:apolipoprotein N-acyltransferase